MSSLETPTLVATTRWTPEGPRTPRSMGLKPTFPQKPFWTPHGSRLLTSPCMNSLQHKDKDSVIKRR
jgi:hypothetical protein